MKNPDRTEFIRTLAAVYVLYRIEFSDAVADLWWAVLEQYELKDVKDALAKHLVNPDTGQFSPKPADVVKAIAGTGNDASMLAWAKVIDGLRRAGTYNSVAFDDPIIHRVLVDLGGWAWLGEQQEREMPFIEKRFRDAYRAWRNRGPLEVVPPHLAGRVEIANSAAGHLNDIPEPVLIGNEERAALIAKQPARKALSA